MKPRSKKQSPTRSRPLRPGFFKPFSLDKQRFPVFPEAGHPRTDESRGLIDWFVARELKEGPATWKKKQPRYPQLITRGLFEMADPLGFRENLATHIETEVGLHKMLSWIESGGDEYAIRSEVEALWQMLESAIRRLNRIALDRPELLRPFAEDAHVWPVLYSEHKSYRQKNEKVIENLHLAANQIFPFDKAARNDFENPLTDAAVRLVSYLVEASKNLCMMSSYRKRNAEEWAKFSLPDWYLAAEKLEPFSKQSFPQWWKLAKEVFEDAYPEPEKETRFANVETGKKAYRRRAQIIWLIGDRMEKLAKQEAQPIQKQPKLV